MITEKKFKILLWLSVAFILISMIFCILKEPNDAIAIGFFSSAISILCVYFIFYK